VSREDEQWIFLNANRSTLRQGRLPFPGSIPLASKTTEGEQAVKTSSAACRARLPVQRTRKLQQKGKSDERI
jgi:hypothetical protein